MAQNPDFMAKLKSVIERQLSARAALSKQLLALPPGDEGQKEALKAQTSALAEQMKRSEAVAAKALSGPASQPPSTPPDIPAGPGQLGLSADEFDIPTLAQKFAPLFSADAPSRSTVLGPPTTPPTLSGPPAPEQLGGETQNFQLPLPPRPTPDSGLEGELNRALTQAFPDMVDQIGRMSFEEKVKLAETGTPAPVGPGFSPGPATVPSAFPAPDLRELGRRGGIELSIRNRPIPQDPNAPKPPAPASPGEATGPSLEQLGAPSLAQGAPQDLSNIQLPSPAGSPLPPSIEDEVNQRLQAMGLAPEQKAGVLDVLVGVLRGLAGQSGQVFAERAAERGQRQALRAGAVQDVVQGRAQSQALDRRSQIEDANRRLREADFALRAAKFQDQQAARPLLQALTTARTQINAAARSQDPKMYQDQLAAALVDIDDIMAQLSAISGRPVQAQR